MDVGGVGGVVRGVLCGGWLAVGAELAAGCMGSWTDGLEAAIGSLGRGLLGGGRDEDGRDGEGRAGGWLRREGEERTGVGEQCYHEYTVEQSKS